MPFEKGFKVQSLLRSCSEFKDVLKTNLEPETCRQARFLNKCDFDMKVNHQVRDAMHGFSTF